MTKQELAEALDVSPSMVSRLAKRGMPTDSIERARRWRERHLDPARRKEHRALAPSRAAWPAPDDAGALALVEACERAGMLMHSAMGTPMLDLTASALRAAMQAVPAGHRGRVRLPVEALDVLLGPALASIDLDPAGAADMTDDEADAAGQLLFAIGAGEMAPTPDLNPTPGDHL